MTLNFKAQLKIYTKRKIASKNQNLEHKCILQSCKTVRRWQRSILLVKGDHCITTTSANERNKLNDEQRLAQVTSIWQIIALRM